MAARSATTLAPLNIEDGPDQVIGNFISCTVHRTLFSLVKMMDAGVEFVMRQRQLAANVAGYRAEIIVQGNATHFVAQNNEDVGASTSGTWQDME